MIQYQTLQTNIVRIVWHTVRRITTEILGVKRLIHVFVQSLVHLKPLHNCYSFEQSRLLLLNNYLPMLPLTFKSYFQCPSQPLLCQCHSKLICFGPESLPSLWLKKYLCTALFFASVAWPFLLSLLP